MVAVKANDRQRFLSRLPGEIVVVVAYGSDAGLIAETAAAAAQQIAAREDPPGEVLRIEDADLENDPDRLIVELQTLPMFGGTKIVRTSISRRINANLLKPIIEAGPPAAALVIEAGNLKPTDALRKLAEKPKWSAAIPCFSDSAQDIARMIDDMVASAGKSIEPDARSQLQARLGADRALSRSEIDKLILSVGERREIAETDVLDIVGDVSELSLDRVVLAAADGNARDAIAAMERAMAAGQAAQQSLLALQRHFLMLHKLRSAVDSGKRLEDAIRTVRPPLHFKLRDAVTRQCRIWNLPALNRALSAIQAAVKTARSNTHVEVAVAERVALELARLSKTR